MKKVYLGIPTHDGRMGQGMINAIFSPGRSLEKTQIEQSSALVTNFNKCYANALNNRRHGITHFCLLHEDIWIQEPMWLDKMLAIMERVGADVLGTVIPIKDSSGQTSTALEVPDEKMLAGFRAERISLLDAHIKYNPTFTHPRLLLNSGLLLVDIRAPLADKVFFEFKDWIAPHPTEKGSFIPASIPEDYVFTRKCRDMGARIYATREIRLKHMGGGAWENWLEKAPSEPLKLA